MGTWGLGNFDSDRSLSILDDVVDSLTQIILESFSPDKIAQGNYLESQGESKLLPAIDLLITICEHYVTPTRLEDENISNWKSVYLNVFDRDIGLYYASEAAAKRRAIVIDTFDRLERLVNTWKEIENS